MNEASLWPIIQRGVLFGRTPGLKIRMSAYLGIDVLGNWFLSGDFGQTGRRKVSPDYAGSWLVFAGY